MKLFAADWGSFLRLLDDWGKLEIEERGAYLDAKGDADQLPAFQFGYHLDALLYSGFLKQRPNSEEPVCSVPFDCLEFRRILLKLRAVKVFLKPCFASFEDYASKHFSRHYYSSFLDRRWGKSSRQSDLKALFELVSSEEWTKRILGLEKSLQFEYAHLNKGERRYWLTPRMLKQTQQLIRLLSQSSQPVPLRELEDVFGHSELPQLLSAGLRYMAFFPALHPDTLEPVVGLWTKVVERLNAPKPQPPAPIKAKEEFCAPFLLDDMIKVLVACSSRPLRLRGSDGRLFARQQEELASQLSPLPGWLEETLSFDATQRIGEALVCLSQLRLIGRFGTPGEDFRLEVNPEGKKWLSLEPQQRLGSLMDSIRNADQEDFRSFLPWDIEIHSASLKKKPDLNEAVANCYRSLARGEFFDFHPFGLFHRVQSNPLRGQRLRRQRFSLSLGWKRFDQLSAERLEQIWYNLLLEFLRQRLIPTGGVRIGYSSQGSLCFALTEAGLYLLGETDKLKPQKSAKGELIVQPNFEIVFMAPSPLAEAEIGRFAHRSGKEVGVLFKLTKSSVTAAVGAGLSAQQILQTLAGLSSREIPSNVEKEIEAWAGQCRHISFRKAILIRCPDAETAGKVVSLAGKKAQLLNETTLELTDAKAKTPLLNKLRKAGVFLE